jgi:hypothetical protein
MATLSYTQAFRSYGAKLANPIWTDSAIAGDGALVLSCWSHKFKFAKGVLTYSDRLSHRQADTSGKKLLAEHLSTAREQSLVVRMVVATTDQPDVVDRGEPVDAIKKTFHVKPDVVGKITAFDGDDFVIEFRSK